jgi:hypothetical protein
MSIRCEWIFLPALLLAGCTVPRPADPGSVITTTPVIEENRSDDATKVLAYYAQVRQLSGPDLVREHESARRALAKSRSDSNRVRYALLLTLPGAAAGEDPRELLEPVARNSDSALRGLATLMMTFLQEQRRLETNAQGLQQKLDALLTLERNMTRDGSGTRKR